MSSEAPMWIGPQMETLAASELQLLADMCVELADRYERNAMFMDDEQGRQLAMMLARWRRDRGRYFQELSAAAERVESPYLEWERSYLNRAAEAR